MAGSLSLGELAERIGGSVVGDASRKIHDVATLDEAGPEEISFLTNPRYRSLAERTRADYGGALELIRSSSDAWRPRAMVVSALESEGISEIWETILEHHELMQASGEFDERRRKQSRAWMWKLLEDGIGRVFRELPGMREAIEREEEAVAAQKTTPAAAARALLQNFR